MTDNTTNVEYPDDEREIEHPTDGVDNTSTGSDDNTSTASDDNTSSDELVREKVEHTKYGVTLSLESKRGTGTRDQDTVKATVRAETMDELDNQRRTAREMVIEEMNTLRTNQPDQDDE